MRQSYTLFLFFLVVIVFKVKTRVDGYSAQIWRSNTMRDPQCRDHHRECRAFKYNKHCENPMSQHWMKTKCARTCGFCVPKKSRCQSYKHGCCQDRVTPADGPYGKGCAGVIRRVLPSTLTWDEFRCMRYRSTCGSTLKLCVDTIVCDNIKKACGTESRVFKNWITERCAATCGLCGAPANPKKKCEITKPIYGCCWNGDEATGPGNEGCPACIDSSRYVCNLLKDKCHSKFYFSRNFMEQHCPQTCGQCPFDCYDTKEKCSKWAREGLCKRTFWNRFMKKHCPRSCGHCQDGELET